MRGRREIVFKNSGQLPADEPIDERQSLLHHSPGLILLAILITDAYRFADPDLWGHVGFGRLFIASGRVPWTDPFNYSAPGHAWLHHEWLAEVAMAWLYGHFGVIGLKLLKFASSAATVIFVALAMAETGASITVQIATLLATSIGIGLEVQIRPQMFTFALFAATIALLARDNYGRRAPLWVTIPMFALWGNLHGGFFMGLVAMAVYGGVVGMLDLRAGHGIRRALWILSITAVSALVTFATPFGIHSWDALIVSIRNPITSRVMADWRPLLTRLWAHPRASGISLYFYFALSLIAASAISFAVTPHGGDLPVAAVAAMMSAGAFAATRNIALAAIAIAPVLCRHAGLIVIARGHARGGAPDTTKTASRRGWVNEFVLLAAAVYFAFYTALFSRRLPDAVPAPSGAVSFMSRHRLSGNILDQFTWGQYLIWHCAPASKVFIDSRYDLAYPLGVVRDYIMFIYGDAGAERVLARYPHDFVLLNTDCRGYGVMLRDKAWTLIYRDPVCALFARADSPAARIPGVPFAMAAAPPSYFP